MPKRRVAIGLALIATLSALSGVVGVFTAPEPRTSTIPHNVSMGIVASAIFYVIVVLVPERQRKARIHRNLQRHYDAFRASCIAIFLIASRSQEYRPKEMLFNQEEFRRYFKVDIGNDQTRWDAVLNALNGNRYLLRDIQYELEILREELLYVLSAIDVDDEEVFAFVKRLAHAIYRLKDTEPEYDDIKHMGGFLWEVFTGWSVVEGYRPKDIVQSMIDRI